MEHQKKLIGTIGTTGTDTRQHLSKRLITNKLNTKQTFQKGSAIKVKPHILRCQTMAKA